MPIRFSIAKRGVLPQEEEQQILSEEVDVERLRPQLKCLTTVDAVEFQSSSHRLPSVLPQAELLAALSTLQIVMVHELKKGNAVSLPGIGTFRLSLKGGIEVKDGNYHGKDVRVEGLQFRPDSKLLSEIRSFEVDQVPYGLAFRTEKSEVETRLAELFASKTYITHKDVSIAFEQTLTRSRVTSLLKRLVKEGRLVCDGKGAQTRYSLP
jgi:nucleoid DNA-binding protein